MKKEHFEIYAIDTATGHTLPFVGEGKPAGFTSPATDYVGERIDLNDVLIMNPGSTYYARVKDYFMVEEELDQGDAILFDTSLAPRTGDLALCEIDGERLLKYVKRHGREITLVDGSSSETVPVNSDTEARVLGIVTVTVKVRRDKSRRTRSVDLLTGDERLPLFTKRAIKASYFPESTPNTSGLIDLNRELIHNPVTTFFGKVKGNSLADDDINDGDSVIVDRSLEPRWMDLAVCVTGDGFTMKYVDVLENGQVWLLPGNDEYRPILITEENKRLIWGVVTHSIKQLQFKGEKKTRRHKKKG